MSTEKEWYLIDTVNRLDTPALAIYQDRVNENIQTLVKSIDDITRLRPHVKTHKSSEVCIMMLQAGITKFKCSTIAEAEMLAIVGAPDVMLAYQPVGPKADRLAALVQQFPSTYFSCLIDNVDSAKHLSGVFQQLNLSLNVYIDLNVGMNRTGVQPIEALKLYDSCKSFAGISISGLHAYDGHIHDADFAERKKKCDQAFASVLSLQKEIIMTFDKELQIVVGGTPTYSIHCKRKEVECSPGTFIYWDHGYQSILAEQHYLPAALVVTRVISKPTPDMICIDLGHKAIASENPLHSRIHFLNASNLKPVGHSEEHMTFKVEDGKDYRVGEVLYGIPYHVCPTIALHDRAAVVKNNTITSYWNCLSRNRKISI